MAYARSMIGTAKRVGVEAAAGIMREDQMEKMRVATEAAAALLANELAGGARDGAAQGEVIRARVDGFRFEADKSGYFFVYRDTEVVALPTKKELVGMNLGERGGRRWAKGRFRYAANSEL